MLPADKVPLALEGLEFRLDGGRLRGKERRGREAQRDGKQNQDSSGHDGLLADNGVSVPNRSARGQRPVCVSFFGLASMTRGEFPASVLWSRSGIRVDRHQDSHVVAVPVAVPRHDEAGKWDHDGK